MPTDLFTQLHEQTIRLDIHEVVRRLNGHLGATLVATLAGARDRKLPYRWAQSDGPTPKDEAITRLHAAHAICKALADAENEYVVRAWFIGVNPRLDDCQPVIALREGRIGQTMAAAKAFIDGTDE
jgi:hypothetical protein